MKFPGGLIEGRLIKRYKRFLADVSLTDGRAVTAHCPNTGAMTGCAIPGSRVWLLPSSDPRRKLAFTWELVETDAGDLVCVHAARANALFAEALAGGRIAELADCRMLRREVNLAGQRSRLDFLLQSPRGPCYVEVKSVTLLAPGGVGLFPDTVSARATRHVGDLSALSRSGCQAFAFFAALHSGIHRVSPAAAIDDDYVQAMREARDAGVVSIAYGASMDTSGIDLRRPLPFLLS